MDINTITQGAKHFKVREGSNYKVTDSFKNEYVINFDHFQKLNNSLFNGEGDFTTINNSVVNKRYIYKIEPTNELTMDEIEERFERENIISAERLKLEKEDIAKRNHMTEFFNKKYGLDKWSFYPVNKNVHWITEDDFLEWQKDFKKTK